MANTSVVTMDLLKQFQDNVKNKVDAKETKLQNQIDVCDTALIDIVDSGYKNIIHYPQNVTSYEANGIVFTIDRESGTVTANGTATADARFYIYADNSGKFVLSGCPAVPEDDPDAWSITCADKSTGEPLLDYDGNPSVADTGQGGVEVVLVKDAPIYVKINIYNGRTANNLIFKPMLCEKYAWDISHAFVPYRASDNDLAKITSDTIGLLSKNYIELNCSEMEFYGVTCTPNDDGTITLNGTITTDENVSGYVNLRTGAQVISDQYDYHQLLPPGEYIVSGGLNSVGLQVCTMTSKDTSTLNIVAHATDVESRFTITEDMIYSWVRMRIYGNVRSTYNNDILLPMIRRADITDDTFMKYNEPLDSTINRLQNAAALHDSSIGNAIINMFNKDGEINYLYDGTFISNMSEDPRNTVNGSTITFIRQTDSDTCLTGQFISGLYNKSVIVSGECVSVGTSSTGTCIMGMYKRNDPTIYNTRIFDIGEFSYNIHCDDTDEWLFAFGTNGTGDGVQIKNLMIRDASISDPTYVEYIPSLQTQISAADNSIANAVDRLPKNLIKPVPTEHGGVTITVDDGQMVLNGTISSSTNQIYAMSLVYLEAGVHYVLVDELHSDTYYVHLRDSETLTEIGDHFLNTLNPRSKDFTVDTSRYYLVAVRLLGGGVYDNLILRPMICLKSDYDMSNKFVPYVPTNDELDSKINDMQNQINEANTTISSVIDRCCKNLIKPVAGTRDGVTITVDGDGQIVLNGTNSSSSNLIYKMSLVYLEAGVHYVFVDELHTDKYYVHLRDSETMTTQGSFWTSHVASKAKDFTVDVSRYYLVAITVYSGESYTDLTLRPMICRKDEYDQSPGFVKYKPTGEDLQAQINALIERIAALEANPSVTHDTTGEAYSLGIDDTGVYYG